MKLNYTLCTALLLVISICARGQNIGYRYNDSIPILLSSNDTLNHPFAGGLTAPQFNSIDIDLDGKKDLLVFDRAGARVLPYLNKGGAGEVKYQYAPQYISKLPKFANWVVTVDYNRDGKEDIFTPGFNPVTGSLNGMLRVWLNTSTSSLSFKMISDGVMEGTPKSHDPAFPLDSFPYPLPVTFNDRPAITDIDGDGDIDYLMPQPGGLVLLYKNYQVQKSLSKDSLFYRVAEYSWGAVNIGDPIQLGVPNDKYYGYKANAHFATSLTALDYDGDGDKDMLVGDAFKNTLSLLKNGKVDYNWKYQNIPCDTIFAFDNAYPAANPANIPQLLLPFNIDINNDGKNDLVVAPYELTDVKTVNQVWYYENTGTASVPVFTLIKKNFLQEEMLDLGNRFAPALLDFDQDGDKDLLAATQGDGALYKDSSDRLVLYENIGSSGNPTYKLADTNYLNLVPNKYTWMRPAVGDLNRDGKPDILLGLGNGTLTYIENTTTGAGPMSFAAPITNFENIDVGLNSSPAIFDLNFDNYTDLVIGNDGGRLLYFRNHGSPSQPYIFSSAPDVDSLGAVGNYTTFSTSTIHPYLFDHRNDSMVELVIGSTNGTVQFYRVSADLKNPFTLIDTCLSVPWIAQSFSQIPGNTSRAIPLISYISNDTVPDLMVGSHYGGMHFFKGFIRGELTPILGRDTVQVMHTGIRQIATLPQIQFYPNPAGQSCNMRMAAQHGELNVELFSVLGEKLHSEKVAAGKTSAELHLQAMPPGMLLVKVSDPLNGHTQTFRIIHLQ